MDSDDHSKYRMLIGCAQWAIIIGRIDITYATQTMAKFSAAPREGHLKRALRIFGYLKAYAKHGIMYAPGQLTISGSELPDVNGRSNTQEQQRKFELTCLHPKENRYQ